MSVGRESAAPKSYSGCSRPARAVTDEARRPYKFQWWPAASLALLAFVAILAVLRRGDKMDQDLRKICGHSRPTTRR
jgi:hypothetical protein